jgi:hypothetical protein
MCRLGDLFVSHRQPQTLDNDRFFTGFLIHTAVSGLRLDTSGERKDRTDGTQVFVFASLAVSALGIQIAAER